MKRIVRCLDLFCCAGGAGEGYRRSGFEVTGVDIRPQPKNPHTFVCADALEFLREFGHEFDFIHASPPCQAYTKAGKQWRKEGREYPDLIAETRRALVLSGKPWVIENVPGSPLINPIWLNGSAFGIRVHRPRLFESSFPLPQPDVPPMRPVKMGRPIREGDIVQPVGHFSGVAYARQEMGLPWMGQAELAQAIPPAYTEWIARQWLSTANANDGCIECGSHLIDETTIKQALILADLEDKGLMLPVGADSDRAMILINTDGVKANDKSTEPENRRRAATRDLAAGSSS